jgi:3-oxoacyl-[acyl-carrier-protein] synthase-3
MRRCEIAGWGSCLPSRVVRFGGQTRYRVGEDETQLGMLAAAASDAIARSGLAADELDCIIVASAAGVQPIPCTAALLMEQIAPGARAAAFDVNSTCTSFLTAVDVASRYLDDGEYERILIVSGDVGSRYLNPAQRESFELFSDAAAAIVLVRGEEGSGRGVLASLQQTWPRYAHDTEIRGGLSALPPHAYADSDPTDYLFDMNGRAALMGMLAVLPEFFDRFFARAGVDRCEVDLVVPHQASGALALAMRRLGFAKDAYVDNVAAYGNMVSASVPYTLVRCLEEGRVGPGDVVVLCGTAAGLTANALALAL